MRGQFLDLYVIIFVIFMIAVIGVICWMVLSMFYDSASKNTAFSATALQGINNMGKFYTQYDYFMISAYITVLLIVLLSGWFLPSHPALSFFILIFAMIAVIPAAMVVNAWDTFSQADNIKVYADKFVMTKAALPFLPLFVCFCGILYAIITYAKFSGSGP